MSSLGDIRAKFTELLGWEGDKLIPVDFAMAAYASTYLPGERERTWGYLVGAPSGGKTRILESLRDADPSKEGPKRTVILGDLTENCFASGFRSEENPDEDPSLLAKLDYRRKPEGNKVLICKEMGPILELPYARRARFFNQMRMAYDGDYDNNTGNIGHVWYNLGFGFLGAATEKLDDTMKSDQPLGQRTVICRLNDEIPSFEDDRKLATSAITSNPYKKKVGFRDLRGMVTSMMDELVSSLKKENQIWVEHGHEYEERLSYLSTLLVRIRTVPVSGQSMTYDPEKPPRFAGQLVTWGDGRAVLEGRREWVEADYQLIRRIARDTLNPEFLSTLRTLWGRGPEDAAKGADINVIKFKCQSEESMYRQWRQWALVGLVTEIDHGHYAFRPEVIDAILKCGLFDDLPEGV